VYRKKGGIKIKRKKGKIKDVCEKLTRSGGVEGSGLMEWEK